MREEVRCTPLPKLSLKLENATRLLYFTVWLPVQVAELQNVLAGMGQQLQAEQGMRHADAQVGWVWRQVFCCTFMIMLNRRAGEENGPAVTGRAGHAACRCIVG